MNDISRAMSHIKWMESILKDIDQSVLDKILEYIANIKNLIIKNSIGASQEELRGLKIINNGLSKLENKVVIMQYLNE